MVYIEGKYVQSKSTKSFSGVTNATIDESKRVNILRIQQNPKIIFPFVNLLSFEAQ